jgi:Na+-driven multidrug efflux pump
MQLAALGPTSVIFSFSSYVFNALGIATASKVSSLLGQDKVSEASQCAGAALVVALVAGITSCLLLEVPLSTHYSKGTGG